MDTKKKNFRAIMGVALGIGCCLSVQADLKHLKNRPAEGNLSSDKENPEITGVIDEQKAERENCMLNWLDEALKKLSNNNGDVDKLNGKYDEMEADSEEMFQSIATSKQFDKSEMDRAIFDHAQHENNAIVKCFMANRLNKKQSSRSEGNNSVMRKFSSEGNNSSMRKLLKEQQDHRAYAIFSEVARSLKEVGHSHHDPDSLTAKMDRIEETIDENFDATNTSETFDKNAMCRSLLERAQKEGMGNVVLFGGIVWKLKKKDTAKNEDEKGWLTWLKDKAGYK